MVVGISSKIKNSNGVTTSVPNDAVIMELRPEDREHVQIFEKIYDLFAFYAKFFGIEVKYDWIPHKHFMFWFAMSLLVSFWLCMLYTQYVYVRNGEIMKILEVFALYGFAFSVKNKL